MAGAHTSALKLDGVARVAGSTPPAPGPVEVSFAFVRVVGGGPGAGRGRVYGTIKVKGSPDYPVRRRVRLFRDNDGVCVGEVWSDVTTGAYEFTGIDLSLRYTVVSYDSPPSFRAVIADNLTPELMT